MSNVCAMRPPKFETAGRRRRPRRERILVGGAAMGATLARSGHRARTAGDAETLLDALEHRRFDLVLLDLRAPEIDAIATVKLYRYIALGEPQPPIVAVADRRSAADVTACHDAGIEICVAVADAVRVMAEVSTGGLVAPPGGKPGGATVSDIAAHPRFNALH